MTVKLNPLPYAESELEPYISARTVALHYGKHHAGYVKKLNELIQGTEYVDLPLVEIVMRSAKDAKAKEIFNNAAQVCNHDFYWRSMTPSGRSSQGQIKSMLDRDFGGEQQFRAALTKAATGQFGSGWAWLLFNNGKLEIETTSDADTPIVHGKTPLLVIDVWEHAYYLDYENRRDEYVAAWLGNLANWQFADENLGAAASKGQDAEFKENEDALRARFAAAAGHGDS